MGFPGEFGVVATVGGVGAEGNKTLGFWWLRGVGSASLRIFRIQEFALNNRRNNSPACFIEPLFRGFGVALPSFFHDLFGNSKHWSLGMTGVAQSAEGFHEP